jgi:NodT family efflux transporter outer membrane factor (OMF) lipoprotein
MVRTHTLRGAQSCPHHKGAAHVAYALVRAASRLIATHGQRLRSPGQAQAPARRARMRTPQVVGLLACFLAGCTVGPKYHPPAAQAPPVYKESPANYSTGQQQAAPASQLTDPTLGGLGSWTVAQPQDSQLRGKWWEIYNDPDLNALEEQLNIDNQNIKQFFENFMAARSITREAHAQLYPTVTAGASYSRSGGGVAPTVGASGAGGATGGVATGATSFARSAITLPLLGVTWEPDLWGRIRNTVRETQYVAQIDAADLENERLTEQASLAAYWFEIRGQDAVSEILQSTLAADQKALEYARAQYQTGVADQTAVIQAQNTVLAVQSQLTNVGIARAQFEHAIATLIGKPASEFSLPYKPVLSTPPPIPTGLPSQLLERRPDIAAAERAMAQANAQIGVATAAFYPNLNLAGSAGLENSVWSKLLTWPSRFWSVGPSLSEVLFDAGLRRATVNQYIAVYNANVAGYRQTILTAFQQVEDALAAMRILTQQIQQQRQVVETAQQGLELEMARYQTGIDPYINVVTEQTILLTSQQALAALEIQRMTASVSLIEALGGGWDRSQLPTPSEITAKPAKADTAIQQ